MAADKDSMSSRPNSSRVRLLAVDTGKNMMGAYITLVMSAEIAEQLGVTGGTTYNWRNQDQIDRGNRPVWVPKIVSWLVRRHFGTR